MNNSSTIHIIALASLGQGLSGGDRIYIELARRWSKNNPVIVYVWEEGYEMCRRENLSGDQLQIKIIRVGVLKNLGFILTYFYRILLGVWLGLTLKLGKDDYIYSSSEFWMDSLASVILKLRNPESTWVAAWYQTAPNPFKGFAEGQRQNVYRLGAFFYWFMQLPIKPLVGLFADYVLVNNESERSRFPEHDRKSKAVVLIGAVNVNLISEYVSHKKAQTRKKYTAVFQGRFHPQKGVVELVEIWKIVTKYLPDAKLAMIGSGPLYDDVLERVKSLKLENNIELLGFMSDGDTKYDIFSSSQVVVHPAFYDSGGMASAEAMAFGLPCVGFNLKSYESYYPRGMVKVPIGDLKMFAKAVVDLINNKSNRDKIGKDAKDMIYKSWSWDFRAEQILERIGYNTKNV